MEKRKDISGFKKPKDFSKAERKLIVDEYLRSNLTKKAIWKKHTGLEQEHGYILRWMRALGYEIPVKWRKLDTSKFDTMLNREVSTTLPGKHAQLEIAELKKALTESKLQVEGLQTMIEIAEEAYKIDIRKKYYTKRSIK
ncbi:hypothetical protein ACXIHB_10090 [Tenacibaculum sp. IMCC1]|uniref:Transposase n=1 Tax=Tenacibaculum sp. Pbs-1 TaxID=3238748 RepID=A0AB33L3D5_9FLAO